MFLKKILKEHLNYKNIQSLCNDIIKLKWFKHVF